MRYRLPEALGGGECTLLNPPSGNGVYARATIGEGEDAFTIDLDWRLLTPVEPPLPEEPPVGSVGRCDHGYIHIRRGRSWTNHDDVPAVWSEVYSHGFTLLVPDPFAEPVELPWGGSHGLKVSQTHTDSGPGDKVYVSTKGASYGFAHVDPAVAREMARALWAAADAAEKEQT